MYKSLNTHYIQHTIESNTIVFVKKFKFLYKTNQVWLIYAVKISSFVTHFKFNILNLNLKFRDYWINLSYQTKGFLTSHKTKGRQPTL